jgi:hypothetical protein
MLTGFPVFFVLSLCVCVLDSFACHPLSLLRSLHFPLIGVHAHAASDVSIPLCLPLGAAKSLRPDGLLDVHVAGI